MAGPLNVHLKEAEVVGYLDPNGLRKTTTIRMLPGLMTAGREITRSYST